MERRVAPRGSVLASFGRAETERREKKKIGTRRGTRFRGYVHGLGVQRVCCHTAGAPDRFGQLSVSRGSRARIDIFVRF